LKNLDCPAKQDSAFSFSEAEANLSFAQLAGRSARNLFRNIMSIPFQDVSTILNNKELKELPLEAALRLVCR